MLFREADVRRVEQYFHILRRQFPKNTDRKNFFLAACYRIESIVDSSYINDNCEFGGVIGIENSRLDRLFKRYKIFRLHACLHDAAGYMKSEHNLGPGYIYVLNSRINSCFLGHITGLGFCIYLKIFHQDLYDTLHC